MPQEAVNPISGAAPLEELDGDDCLLRTERSPAVQPTATKDSASDEESGCSSLPSSALVQLSGGVSGGVGAAATANCSAELSAKRKAHALRLALTSDAQSARAAAKIRLAASGVVAELAHARSVTS